MNHYPPTSQQMYPPPPSVPYQHQPLMQQQQPPPPPPSMLHQQQQQQMQPPPPPTFHHQQQPQQQMQPPPPTFHQQQQQQQPQQMMQPPPSTFHQQQPQMHQPINQQPQMHQPASQQPPPPPLQSHQQHQQMYRPMYNNQPHQQMHPTSQQPGNYAPRPARMDYNAVPSVPDIINSDIEMYESTDRRLVIKAPATLPPLATTLESEKLNIVLQDGGCARPCHMRSTIYQVPVTKDILETSGLEFSVVIKPFDAGEIDGTISVPLNEDQIIRCNRCNAFENPFSLNGSCCICGFTFSRRPDQDVRRPQTYLGSYEFRNLTPEYYRDKVAAFRRPHIIFAIETTVHSRHIVEYLSKNLAQIIKEHLPSDFMYPGYKLSPLVGFATYNSKITLYDVTNGGHAYVICDVASPPFAITPKFLVDPVENFEDIKNFMPRLLEACDEQADQQSILGPVVEVVLKSCLHDTSNYTEKQHSRIIPAGKLYMFHSTLPTAGDEPTPGRLTARRNIDDMKRQLGTESENKVLAPEGKYYKQLAQKCINDYATGVELFLFPPNPRAFLNIATLGDLASLTGTGIIHKYHTPSLNNFLEDLKFSLKSTMGFDASMRVRTSTGISPVRYIGNLHHLHGSNLEMSAVNANSNFIVQMKYDDKIPENDFFVVQFAMLYTSVCGERRVRVHNLALQACQSYEDLFKMACCDTLMNVMARDTIDKMRSDTLNPRTAKEQLTTRLINLLAAYRKYCTKDSANTSQLILPEGLKLMPIYLCGALKCDAIDGGIEMFPDDKVLAQINLLGATPSQSQVTFYPRMFAIEACNAEDEGNELGLTAKLTRDLRVMIDDGRGSCYVLENGYYLFILFPNTELGQNFLASVYGGQKDNPDLSWDFRQKDTNETKFLELLISQIVQERRRALVISVIRQGRDKLENVFNSFLYEEEKKAGSASVHSKLDNVSYESTLFHLHSEIKSKLAQ